MFINKTAFLIGAGASWHYGYPTGEDLVKEVILRANRSADYFMQNQNNTGSVPLYVEEQFIERTGGMSRAWIQAAKECRALEERLRLVNPPVIDYFLGHNYDLSQIAKLFIAWVILECNAHHQVLNRNVNRPAGAVNGDDWCRFIIYKLLDGCESSRDLLSNEVTFITFNYDVSLEEKIYRGLFHTTLFNPKDVQEFIDNGRFLHVYGSVRDCPPYKLETAKLFVDNAEKFAQDSDGVQAAKVLFNASYNASKRIKTIAPFEKDDQDSVITAARQALRDAACIYILGYGFDRNNNKRLELYEHLRHTNGKMIMFTNYQDRNQINKRASKVFYDNFDYLLPNEPAIRGTPGGPFFIEKSTRNVYDALALDFDELEAQLLPTTPI